MKKQLIKGMSCLLVAVYAMTYVSLFEHLFHDHVEKTASQTEYLVQEQCSCDHAHSRNSISNDITKYDLGSSSQSDGVPEHGACICSILDFLEAAPQLASSAKRIQIAKSLTVSTEGGSDSCLPETAQKTCAPPRDTRLLSPQITHLSTVIITC